MNTSDPSAAAQPDTSPDKPPSGVRAWWAQLDALLRGEATKQELMEGGRFTAAAKALGVSALVMGAVSGLCVGSYWAIREPGAWQAWAQILSSAVKIPLLFLLTLVVTLPSLYVFSVIAGSRLRFDAVIKLMLAMTAIALTVVASLGPIVVFFGLSTTSYPFMKLLNVLAAATGGFVGLAFLQRTLHRLIREPGDGEMKIENEQRVESDEDIAAILAEVNEEQKSEPKEAGVGKTEQDDAANESADEPTDEQRLKASEPALSTPAVSEFVRKRQ